MSEITALNPHIVVRDAARAAEWYGDVERPVDRAEVLRQAAAMFGG